MRLSEKFKIGVDSTKGALLGGSVAAGTGLATVKTTTFFGLITTGSALSIPILGAWAVGGALLFGGLTFVSVRIRKALVRREMEKMMDTPHDE